MKHLNRFRTDTEVRGDRSGLDFWQAPGNVTILNTPPKISYFFGLLSKIASIQPRITGNSGAFSTYLPKAAM